MVNAPSISGTPKHFDMCQTCSGLTSTQSSTSNSQPWHKINAAEQVPQQAPIPTEISFLQNAQEVNVSLSRFVELGYTTLHETAPRKPKLCESATRHITPAEVAFIKELANIRRIGRWITQAQQHGPLSPLEIKAYLNILKMTTHEVTKNLNHEKYNALFSKSLIQGITEDVKALVIQPLPTPNNTVSFKPKRG